VGARSGVACVAEYDPRGAEGNRGAHGYAYGHNRLLQIVDLLSPRRPRTRYILTGALLPAPCTRRMGYRSTLGRLPAVHAGTRALRAACVHVGTRRRQLTVRAKVNLA
jgi:hypothetical protein